MPINRSISDGLVNNKNSTNDKPIKTIETLKIPKVKLRFTITEADLKYSDFSRNKAQNIEDKQNYQQRLNFRLSKLTEYTKNDLYKSLETNKVSNKLKPIQSKQQPIIVNSKTINKSVKEELGIIDSDDNEFDYFDNEDEIFL